MLCQGEDSKGVTRVPSHLSSTTQQELPDMKYTLTGDPGAICFGAQK